MSRTWPIDPGAFFDSLVDIAGIERDGFYFPPQTKACPWGPDRKKPLGVACSAGS